MAQRLFAHELRVYTAVYPLAAAARLARSPLFGSYVVYERGGVWRFAGGAAGEVTLDRRGFRIRWGDDEQLHPMTTDPSRALASILAKAPMADWRAYGWTAFEFAYAQAGLTRLAGDGTLLHLVLPRVEIELDATGITLYGNDRRTLQVLADLAIDGAEEPAYEPVRLAVEDSGEAEYRAGVQSVIDDIRTTPLRKAIVSRTVPVDFDVDLIATYLTGRRNNTPARSFLIDLGDLQAAGFSPETVVEVSADGRVVSQPLAGTRALHVASPARSARLRAQLTTDPKEIFEHAVSVQLACEELTEICRPGTVHVEAFMRVMDRGTVQHLGSSVAGRLAAGRDAWHAFAALFPAVTASGIPKLDAYRAISRYESQPRGLYSGTVFTADSRGALDTALALRTIFRRDGRTWLQAGAGIVGESRPDREFEETCEKLRSVAEYLVPAGSGAPQQHAVPVHEAKS